MTELVGKTKSHCFWWSGLEIVYTSLGGNCTFYSSSYSQYLSYYLAHNRYSGNVNGVIELNTARHLEVTIREGNHAQTDRVPGL